MTNRPSRDQYFLTMAQLVATRATCLRRAVGCVLINSRGHVLATGYNGVAAGLPHCDQFNSDLNNYPFACEGAHLPSGQGLDKCQAIHAEQNALLQCRDCYSIDTAYCTASPCITCVKLLMNTSCRRIVFLHEYPHGDAQDLWEKSRGVGSWIHQLEGF